MQLPQMSATMLLLDVGSYFRDSFFLKQTVHCNVPRYILIEQRPPAISELTVQHGATDCILIASSLEADLKLLLRS
jgi:hypothetical protein